MIDRHKAFSVFEGIMKTIKELKPAEYNPRKISDKKLALLKKTLKEYGDLSGIVFNNKTGNLVGGHQRLKALPADSKITKESFTDKMGTVAKGTINTKFGEFVYREVEWSLEKEKAANIAANKGAGEWDFTELKNVLESLDTGTFDFELTGFELDEVEALLNDSHLDTYEEEIREKEFDENIETKNCCPKCSYEW
tara:strand:- start:9701 stop:10285 length:585 start_codon:yes stop_codon:yes gene_type:complete